MAQSSRMAVVGAAFLVAMAGCPRSASAADPPPAPERGWPDLRKPSHVAADGDNDAALLVGIDHYAFLPSVHGAGENVGAWEAYLTKRGVRTILSLRDSDATNDAILDMAAKAAAAVKPGGTLWFVFVGHGIARPKTDDPPLPADAVLVGADAQQNANIFRRGVAQHDLTTVLLNTPAAPDAHVVMVLDSCFSGKDRDGKALTQGLQAVINTSLVDANVGGAADRLTVLAAGKNDQFAGPLPHGDVPAFSYLTLGAMRGWADANRDGVVSATETIAYAREVLQREPGRRQEPEVTGPDVPLVRGVDEPPPDLEPILNPPVTERETGITFVESRPVPASVWIGAALTVGLVAGGATTGVIALGKHSDFNAANDGSNPTAARDLQSQTRTMNAVTDGLFGGAIVAGVVSTILLVSRPAVRTQLSRAAVLPVLGHGGGGVAVEATF
jgi:hypothetical protein